MPSLRRELALLARFLVAARRQTLNVIGHVLQGTNRAHEQQIKPSTWITLRAHLGMPDKVFDAMGWDQLYCVRSVRPILERTSSCRSSVLLTESATGSCARTGGGG